MAFYKYENTELLNIISSNLAVRRDGLTSNISFELASNTETRIGMLVDDQFRGFMSNTNGIFFSSNNSAGFKKILGPGDISITTSDPLRLVVDNLELGYDTAEFTLTGPGSNLLGLTDTGITNAKLANSNIIIDGSTLVLGSTYAALSLALENSTGLPFTGLTGNINTNTQIEPASITGDKLANATITNNLLANSNIIIGSVTVPLGSAIYSIPMSNITGSLPVSQLPTDLENIPLSQVAITSGNLTTTNISADYLVTQNANITGLLWLGGEPSSNLSYVMGNVLVSGTNLNISAGYDMNILSGDLVIGGTGNIIATNSLIECANLDVGSELTTQIANITDRLWLGSLPNANLSLVSGGWFLNGANLGIASGRNMDVGGNLWIGGNAYIAGNMTVFGTTTIINSNMVTVLDPVITLGGNTVPTLDDQMDRGIAFHWFDSEVSGTAHLGFMGFRDSDRTFRFIPNATDTNQVFTGTNGSAGFDAMTLDSNLTLYGTDSVVGWGANASIGGIRLAGANLEVKSNSTAGWYRLFTAQELNNGMALAKSGTDNLTLDVRYDNTSIGLNGSGQLALKPSGVAVSNLAESNIYIGGTTYTLGQQNTNLSLLNGNAVVFGGQPNTFVSADVSATSNLLISSAGNIRVNSAVNSGYTGMITLSANAASMTAADILFTGTNSSLIGMTLIDSSNSVITMGGASLGTSGYGFRNNAGVLFYKNSADSDWNRLVSLTQLVSGAGIGFDSATNTLYTLTDNTTIETATPGTANLRVKDGGITAAKIASGTISNDKLANSAITLSGVSYALGSSTANLSITGSNLVLFGTEANIGLTGGANGNLTISATANLTVGKHLIAANTFTAGVYSNATLTNMSGTQTLALDFGEASSFLLTLSANADITLSNPNNANRIGQQGIIYVRTPSTGSGHVLRWYKSGTDSAWFFPGGSGGFAPSISVFNSVYDVFNYVVISANPTPIVLVTDATGFSRYS